MARGQQDSITILLGIKGYDAGKVRVGGKGFVVEVEGRPKRRPCPCCECTYVYRHGKGKTRKARSIAGAMARRCILSYDASVGGTGGAAIFSAMERSYYDPTQRLPGTYLLDYYHRGGLC